MLESKDDVHVDCMLVAKKYANEVLPLFKGLFEMLPWVRENIHQKLDDGYTIVGYKGVREEDAKSFEGGLKIHYEAGQFSGQSLKDGFYITPTFNVAKDFAKIAVRRDNVVHDGRDQNVRSSLKTPPDVNDLNIPNDIALECHYQSCEKFYESQACKDKMYIAIVLVKDFFGLKRKKIEHQTDYPHDAASITRNGQFDYIEDRDEIKFNKKEEVYNRIYVVSIPYLEIEHVSLPDLQNHLEKVRSMRIGDLSFDEENRNVHLVCA